MALEDFTTFTEVDPGNGITVAANQIDFTLDVRNTDSYVYKDYGADHFSGDFTHTFKIYTSGSDGTTPYLGVWGLANAVDDFQGIDDASGDYQSILLVYSSGVLYLQLRLCENGSVTLQSIAIALYGTYFVTVERNDTGGANNTGQLTLRVYTTNYYGEAGAVEVGTATIDCGVGEQNDFQYLYALTSFNTGDAGRLIQGTIYDLDIGEGETPVYVSATLEATGEITASVTVYTGVSVAATLEATGEITGTAGIGSISVLISSNWQTDNFKTVKRLVVIGNDSLYYESI